MRPFTLDHALSSAAEQFTRSEFLTYILETKVPGLHFDVDDEERLPKSNMSNHMVPRIVDGAHEAHMIAGHLQNGEGRDCDNAVMKILEEQVSKEDQKLTGGEPGDVVSDGNSHSQCLEFLRSRGPHFLMKNLQDKDTICSALLDMAEHVKVLPPGNEPLPWDVLNMTVWKASLCELMKEMTTVEERCSSLMGTSEVYVLTTSPYSAFLRALAAEIGDAAVKIQMRTRLEVADNFGAKCVSYIKVLGGGKHGKLGDLIIASVKDAVPRGKVKKGEVRNCVIVCAAMHRQCSDGSEIRFDKNAVVIVNKQGEPIGTRIFGPVLHELQMKNFMKILTLADHVT